MRCVSLTTLTRPIKPINNNSGWWLSSYTQGGYQASVSCLWQHEDKNLEWTTADRRTRRGWRKLVLLMVITQSSGLAGRRMRPITVVFLA